MAETDLITELKFAARFAGPNAAELYNAAAEEIQRCHERLKIDHCFTLVAGELVRRELPYRERLTFPDAITCMEADKELQNS